MPAVHTVIDSPLGGLTAVADEGGALTGLHFEAARPTGETPCR